MSHGADLALKNIAGQSPLHLAASFGTSQVISHLLSHSVHVDARDSNGNTPLMAATLSNRLSSVELFFVAKGSLNIADTNKVTPLMAAARQGFDDIAHYLLQAGADVDAVDARGRNFFFTFIPQDVVGNFMHFIFLIILGNTFLHWGAMLGNTALVQEDLSRPDRKHTIDMVNSQQETALLLACREGHADVVNLLLAQKADPTILDHRGQSCLDVAKTVPIKTILLSAGAVSSFQ